jgi:DNA polymerase-1
MAHLHAVDGSNFVMRAFWGYPSIRVPYMRLREEAEAQGREITELPDELTERFVGAVREMLRTLMRDWPCTHLVFAKDSLGPTWRHSRHDGYKKGRDRRFPGSGDLVSLLEPHLDRWGVLHARAEGHEADDVLATLFARGKEKGSTVTLVSGDSDVLQLVPDGARVLCPNPQGTGYVLATETWVAENKKYTARQSVDWKVLRGEDGDGIPQLGVPSKPDKNGRVRTLGVSEPKAKELLERFGSLGAIYEAAERDPATTPPELCVPDPERERLLASRERAYFFRELILLTRDVPLDHLNPALSATRLLTFDATVSSIFVPTTSASVRAGSASVPADSAPDSAPFGSTRSSSVSTATPPSAPLRTDAPMPAAEPAAEPAQMDLLSLAPAPAAARVR